MRDMSNRICTLALVLLLLGTFFSGYTTDHYAVYTEMGKEADLVAADAFASPFLPVNESELERVTASIVHYAMRGQNSAGTRLCFILLSAFLILCCQFYRRHVFRGSLIWESDQLHRSIIAYIHHQEDQK